VVYYFRAYDRPRQELIKEAIMSSGRRVFIYNTYRFLEYSQGFRNKPINKEALSEIMALGASKLQRPLAVKELLQPVIKNTNMENTGEITATLRRPVRNITVSGHFSPSMADIPHITARLVNAPIDIPQFRVTAGTGTVHDFHVHIISMDQRSYLPVGEYKISYSAHIKDMDSSDVDLSEFDFFNETSSSER